MSPNLLVQNMLSTCIWFYLKWHKKHLVYDWNNTTSNDLMLCFYLSIFSFTFVISARVSHKKTTTIIDPNSARECYNLKSTSIKTNTFIKAPGCSRRGLDTDHWQNYLKKFDSQSVSRPQYIYCQRETKTDMMKVLSAFIQQQLSCCYNIKTPCFLYQL